MIFREIQLATGKADALAAFYGERLGVVVIEHVPNRWLSLRIGASMLCFTQDYAHVAVYHFAFNIPSTQFDAAKTWLAAHCDLVKDATGADQFHFADWNADAVYFYDPAGNLIELIARHALPDQHAGPFGAHSFMGVSEIGVVCDDVRAKAARACGALGAKPYRASANDEFMPVGDEHGLLIIVAAGRPWFPDRTVRGQAAPVDIVVAGHQLAQPVQLTPQARISPK